jgi:hypothetical protein
VITFRPIHLRRLAAVSLMGAALWSCADIDSTQPRTRTAGLAIIPTFPAGDLISLDDLQTARIEVRRQDGSLAAEHREPIVERTVDLVLAVEFTPPCELLTVEIQVLDSDDLPWFETEPTEVTVCEDGEVPIQQPELIWVGPGSDADELVILPRTQTIVVGEAFHFDGQALRGGEVVPRAPIGWRSLDPGLVSIADESSGSGQALTIGTARIEARLLNGLTATAILEIVSAPVLLRSPATMTFEAVAGEANPVAQTLQISNGGGDTLAWSVSDEAPWLTLTPTSGSATTETDDVTVSVNASTLQAGTYSATIAVVAEGAADSPRTTTVTLNVEEPPPALVRSPSSMTFSAVEGGADPPNQTVEISNQGGGTLAWSLSVSEGASWLSLSANSGTATTETDQVNVGVDISGLNPGTYTATITISGADATDSPEITSVTLIVGERPLAIVRAPESMIFEAVEGGGNPASQTLQISNGGGGTLNWSVSDNAPWLSLGPSSGSATEETDPVTVRVDISGRTAGTYTGIISIAASGSTNSPQTTAVTLNVAERAPAIARTPASMVFDAIEGEANPASQTLRISNGGGGTLNWSVNDNAPWLSLAPSSGSATEETDAVAVRVDITGLTAGTYTGTIRIVASGSTNTPQTTAVTLNVAERVPAIVRTPESMIFDAVEGEANPTSQTLRISNGGGGTLNWSVSDNAPWLSLAPSSGSATEETDAVTVSADITGLSGGTYTATIVIESSVPDAAPETASVTLRVGAVYAVQVTGLGGGSGFVSGGGIACVIEAGDHAGDCDQVYPEGSSITLTAAADEGDVFLGWGGACAGFNEAATCTLTVDSDMAVTATFDVADPTPFIFGLTASLVELNSESCPVTPLASRFRLEIEYVDPDGDVYPEGAAMLAEWEFLPPPGQSGTFIFGEESYSDVVFTGSPSAGHASGTVCVQFNSWTEIQFTITLRDAGGNSSNALVVTIPRPEGAN